MLNQYADSDSRVKARASAQFRTLSEARATMVEMRAKKIAAPKTGTLETEEPISAFIRELIRRWQNDGKLIKDLAKEAGLAPSMPSQIKAKTSDATFYTASKLARPFGYRDLPALVLAGWEWFHEGRFESVQAHAPEPASAEAVRLAKRFGMTDEQIHRVLVRWPLADYPDQDELWWLARFQEERQAELQTRNSGLRPTAPIVEKPRRRRSK